MQSLGARNFYVVLVCVSLSFAIVPVAQRNTDQVLALLVDRIVQERLRFDLYEVDPNSILSKLLNFFSFEDTKLHQQRVQQIFNQLFEQYHIIDIPVRRQLLDQVGFVLRDHALQAWVSMHGEPLAQKIVQSQKKLHSNVDWQNKASKLTWEVVENCIQKEKIPLPAFHTRAHQAAAKSYVMGCLQCAVQSAV